MPQPASGWHFHPPIDSFFCSKLLLDGFDLLVRGSDVCFSCAKRFLDGSHQEVAGSRSGQLFCFLPWKNSVAAVHPFGDAPEHCRRKASFKRVELSTYERR